MTFDSLGLAPEYLRAVADEGYTEPTPVQRQAIPLVLAGRDLLAGAQTGTGKTAAFVLPLLQRLHASDPQAGFAPSVHSKPARPHVRALVLTPTRELALQVEESFRTYGRHRPMRSVAIYGGVGFEPQARALRAGTPIVVATPGRLLDHVTQRTIDLSRVEVLVLDEADRMLDMGFIRDIRRVMALLPAKRQSLLFSATFSDDIRGLAEGLLLSPATVDVAPRNTAAELVDQLVIPVDRERKRELLAHLVKSGRISQALVFTRTKHGANRLAEQLGRDGIGAAAIHGNKSQGQRIRALDDFKSGRVGILVATDIAARGIDIEALPHVVNFELPMVASDYVHRIGRTGRAGVGGRAVSLVCIDENELLRDIQRLLRRPLPSELVAGFEPDRSVRAEPIRVRSGDPGHRSGDTRHRSASRTGARPAPATYAKPQSERAARPSAGAPIGRGESRPAAPQRTRPAGHAGSHRAGPPAHLDRRGPSIGQRPAVLPGERLRRAAEPTHTSSHHAGAGPAGERNR
ncbi:MAG: DEAD/DEAH box helicase [Candidatus Limnocylindrales bacterium]